MKRSRYPQRPNHFRCVKALYPTFVSIIILWFYDTAVGVICNLSPAAAQVANCGAPMPIPLLWTLSLIFWFGLVRFSYRVYRDFYCGDLLIDSR